MNNYFALRVTSDFSSSHQLLHYEGKCEHLHGHNFLVEVEVRGTKLDEKLGILMDFKILKKYLAEIIELLDHKHLNELPDFMHKNPSSEYLAKFVFDALSAKLQNSQVQLAWAMVAEKHSSKAFFVNSNICPICDK